MKNLLYLAIFTTIVTASWIGFSVYHNSVTSTISPDVNIKIKAIVPEFNRETIERVRSKKIVEADITQKRPDASIIATQQETLSSSGSASIQESTASATTKVSTSSAGL